MKYFILLLGVAASYYFLGRSAPIKPVVRAMTSSEEIAPLVTGPRTPAPAVGPALKRPLDRTHAVLGQVEQRNGAGEF